MVPGDLRAAELRFFHSSDFMLPKLADCAASSASSCQGLVQAVDLPCFAPRCRAFGHMARIHLEADALSFGSTVSVPELQSAACPNLLGFWPAPGGERKDTCRVSVFVNLDGPGQLHGLTALSLGHRFAK